MEPPPAPWGMAHGAAPPPHPPAPSAHTDVKVEIDCGSPNHKLAVLTTYAGWYGMDEVRNPTVYVGVRSDAMAGVMELAEHATHRGCPTSREYAARHVGSVKLLADNWVKLGEALSESDRRVEELEEALSESDRRVEELEEALSESDRRVEELEEQLARKEKGEPDEEFSGAETESFVNLILESYGEDESDEEDATKPTILGGDDGGESMDIIKDDYDDRWRRAWVETTERFRLP